ncbi:uncharacterized protein I303_102389 [Kwoniella dejecticola CBS 10117]|uniref:alpha-galactosidase n=1 Tax=Kwoniella dejecticola CBS 10117 TaxID=1296121 RepID=A0A1A6AB44_9TREE|nr:uncharacterized protein I303_01472 [Kwoniella dejecticola CBS 10117]OBR87270.1 hypothetical protein I303_01472 [Kwoniella dejecticola CBS 10117]
MVTSTYLLASLLATPVILAKEQSSSALSCSPVTVTQTVTSTVTVISSSTQSSVAATSVPSSKIVTSSKSSSILSSSSKSEDKSAKPTSSASKSEDKASRSGTTSLVKSSTIDDKSASKTSTTGNVLVATGSAVSPSSTPFTPNLSTSFIYDLDNQPIDVPVIKTKSGLSLNKTMYVVDMAQSTPEQIANYHSKGKKVGCYFSAGTWEPFRTDAKSFLPECYCGPNVTTDSTGKCTGKGASDNLLGEWGEWWLDIKSEKCLSNTKEIMTARIKAAFAKGCDAVDPDNVDAWTNTQNFGITKQDEVNYLLWLSSTARANGLGIDLKNSGDLITDPDTGKATSWTSSLVNAFDFNVIESCHEYNECDKYDPFLKAGKPQVRIEYSNSIRKCPSLKSGQQLLVYSGTTVDSNKITLSCP